MKTNNKTDVCDQVGKTVDYKREMIALAVAVTIKPDTLIKVSKREWHMDRKDYNSINALDILRLLGNNFSLRGDGFLYRRNLDIDVDIVECKIDLSQSLVQWDEFIIKKLYELLYENN